MTTEELIAVGLPAEPEVQEPRTSQHAEDKTSPTAGGPGNHEDGEIRSEEEDMEDIDTN
jgi:hypothetical protein